MYEFFNIGEIADFFQIPKSKLRYWDKEGLIQLSRNTGNDYREYSLKAVADVANIAFYRSLDIPIKQLKKLSQMDVAALEKVLESTQARIDKEIENLQLTKTRLMKKIASIAKIKAYADKPFEYSFNPMLQVVEFDKENREHLRSVIDDSERFVLIFDNKNADDYVLGIATDTPQNNETVIWQNSGKEYLKGVLRLPHEDRNLSSISKNFKELQELYHYMDGHGYNYGKIIARFLIAEFGETPANYYETFVELCNQPPPAV